MATTVTLGAAGGPGARGLTQGESSGCDLPYGVHRDDQPGIAGNSAASGQSARCTLRPPVSPRQISSVTSGRRGAAIRHTVSSTVYRVSKASRKSASGPETVAAATHVPVGQNVAEIAQGVRRERGVEIVEVLRDLVEHLSGLREQVTVEHVRAVGPPLRRVSALASRVRVEGEEVVRAPEREQQLADTRADALLGDDEVAAADDGR